jgi:hypothetical protein
MAAVMLRDVFVNPAAFVAGYALREFDQSVVEERMTLEQDFLATAADKLAQNMSRIETCMTKLPVEFLWMRDSENENAVGNLLLHLEGNVRQWILSGIGGAPDSRDRPSEFSARSGPTASVLLTNLGATVDDALKAIRTLPHPRLVEKVSIQGYETSVLAAIVHVVEHFSGHTYQIILLTKRATRQDLGFYSYLARTGRKETKEAKEHSGGQ